jgi:hypothetical protein
MSQAMPQIKSGHFASFTIFEDEPEARVSAGT